MRDAWNTLIANGSTSPDRFLIVYHGPWIDGCGHFEYLWGERRIRKDHTRILTLDEDDSLITPFVSVVAGSQILSATDFGASTSIWSPTTRSHPTC